MILEMKEARVVADINDSAGTDVELFQPAFAGYIDLSACYIEWTEATGSQTTTQGVVSISIGGTEVGSVTASQSGAVGDCQAFVPDGTVATTGSPHAEFSAGDVILIEIKTQAVDGTVTGEGLVHMALSYGA